MCGINIALGEELNITEMVERTKHRGTRIKIKTEKDISFGGIRLPIQGLLNKYDTPYETNDYIIMYNGEIFNFKEIDDNAESDIQLLENPKYSDFDGDFAVVRYNKEHNILEITTDQYGKKQLYYKIKNGKILGISSEVKGLMDKSDKLDMRYMSTVAKFGYVFDSNRTICEDIKKFMPGQTYWIDIKNRSIIGQVHTQFNKYEYIDKYKNGNFVGLLNLAIERRLVSDIPVSLVYSGGLDSSIILYHLSKLKKKVKIFTIENSDDKLYAEKYADELGMKIHYIKLDENEYESAHTANECAVDLGSVLPKYQLFKKIAANGYHVAIGGSGADEVFGGYKRMREFDFQQNDIFNELIYYHLPRLDRISMAHTVEYRTPYTADYIIKVGLSLPYEKRIDKKYLRENYKEHLPGYIINRKKQPLKTKQIRFFKEEERLKLVRYFKEEIFDKLRTGEYLRQS